MLLTSVLLYATWLPFCLTSSISVIVPANRQDCLFLQKEAGEKMVVELQVTQGKKIGLRILGPQREVLEYKPKIEEFEIDQKIKTSGEYAFCFLNSHSYTESVAVHFEYDLHEDGETEEGRFDKQLKYEKKMFIKKQLLKMKPKVADAAKLRLGLDKIPEPVINTEYDNSTLGKVEETLIMLSIQMDRMDHFLKMKTAKMAYGHFIQRENRQMVTFFSVVLCILIVLSACVQVVVLKGFINGKRSWKVWKF